MIDQTSPENNLENNMENNKMSNPNKKFLGAVVLIIILAVSGYVIYKSNLREKKESSLPKNVIAPEVVKVPEDKLQKELPVGFPKDLALNGKMKNIESYNVGYAQGSNTKQATALFESSKSIKENYDFYSKWSKDNKWETVSSSKQENLMSLYAQKGRTSLNIVIIPKTSGGAKSEVNVTYAEF